MFHILFFFLSLTYPMIFQLRVLRLSFSYPYFFWFHYCGKVHVTWFYCLNRFSAHSAVVLSTSCGRAAAARLQGSLHLAEPKLCPVKNWLPVCPLSALGNRHSTLFLCTFPFLQPSVFGNLHSNLWYCECGLFFLRLHMYDHAIFVWLLSLSMKPPRCIHVVASGRTRLFLLKAE